MFSVDALVFGDLSRKIVSKRANLLTKVRHLIQQAKLTVNIESKRKIKIPTPATTIAAIERVGIQKN